MILIDWLESLVDKKNVNGNKNKKKKDSIVTIWYFELGNVYILLFFFFWLLWKLSRSSAVYEKRKANHILHDCLKIKIDFCLAKTSIIASLLKNWNWCLPNKATIKSLIQLVSHYIMALDHTFKDYDYNKNIWKKKRIEYNQR